MKIWKSDFSLDQINSHCKTTIHSALGLVFTGMGDNFLEATLPVDHRTVNPMGILHGGASVVLAESLGSIASTLVTGVENYNCVGTEINASHLRSVHQGEVLGRVKPIRLGKKVHIWNIEIFERGHEQLGPTCVSRLSVFVLKKSKINSSN